MDYELEDLLMTVIKQNASDLHFSVARRPTLRIDGELVPLSQKPILTPDATKKLVDSLLTKEQAEKLEREREVDFSYSFKDKGRFRINVFYQRNFLGAALRLIPAEIRTVEQLRLPPIIHQFTRYNQGFFLVVGPSGHGKSTTLAALVDEINHKRNDHIITIEDPIEYLFLQDRCIVDQREVGSDTLSFHRALRAVLRQDPDVIMVGELRDPETMSTAITAAETGHLVFASIHTNNASQTIDRIIDSFPSGQQNQIRTQLSATLLGVFSQRLIPRIEGGRIPVGELLIANAAVRNLIRENKSHQIDLVIETSAEEGMISLNRALVEMVKQREISLEQAELYSLNPAEMRMILQR
ncbi:type IV pili twitching motility protein PilT [Candidatus Azambacteria bacterium RIFCSPHIGHO2_01_46_10]|uniref:Type IV pili twitching motility protein PilT n=2 Tax=Candidatus Azamiibacteriota TaxID=1752741 RepID=A0A1F5BXQ1_9BACT|nr:MAG: type IV pili twitching motility protein PilT [Candidatus Azambacteria bacterium RIFCSPHIGHO2_02_46_12]OGD35363.1 MAG: type IV pili twitching motility protein PilT [Candidatus Azambacteria bacterium RIFCSPHIGHO2_01_46_10]